MPFCINTMPFNFNTLRVTRNFSFFLIGKKNPFDKDRKRNQYNKEKNALRDTRRVRKIFSCSPAIGTHKFLKQKNAVSKELTKQTNAWIPLASIAAASKIVPKSPQSSP